MRRRLCQLCRLRRALPSCLPQRCWVSFFRCCQDCWLDHMVRLSGIPRHVWLNVQSFFQDDNFYWTPAIRSHGPEPTAGHATQVMVPVSSVDGRHGMDQPSSSPASIEVSSTEWDIVTLPPPIPAPMACTLRSPVHPDGDRGCVVCGRWYVGEPWPFRFPFCLYCEQSPSYHHGRCCPYYPGDYDAA